MKSPKKSSGGSGDGGGWGFDDGAGCNRSSPGRDARVNEDGKN